MNKDITINKHLIGKGNPVFVVAEAGVNHNGDLELAKEMIDAAKTAGADAIKFQTFKTEKLVTSDAPKAKYQKTANSDKSQFAMLKKLEFSGLEFKILFDYCKRRGILFLSTAFDLESAELLNALGILAFKISSGDLTDTPLLQKISSFKKPVILSTGMSTLTEVKEAARTIYSTGNKKLILLHCTSNYPARYPDVNLRAIETLHKEFNLPVGYSDHTDGIEISIAAVAMGACVIEKHFTLDKNLLGPDHKASLAPEEFKRMVESIRHVEEALGNGVKEPRKSEIEIRSVVRKSLVTTRDIPKGVKITRDMLAIKRPGTGIAPKDLNCVIGKSLQRMIRQDQPIKWGLIA